MGKRIEFNYYIGLKGGFWVFEQALIREASRLAGGCTVTRNVGYWIEGADKPQVSYAGPIGEEFCFHLQFSVEPGRVSEISYRMRSCIRQEARKHSLDINWVHVTVHDIKALHFQVVPGEIR